MKLSEGNSIAQRMYDAALNLTKGMLPARQVEAKRLIDAVEILLAAAGRAIPCSEAEEICVSLHECAIVPMTEAERFFETESLETDHAMIKDRIEEFC